MLYTNISEVYPNVRFPYSIRSESSNARLLASYNHALRNAYEAGGKEQSGSAAPVQQDTIQIDIAKGLVFNYFTFRHPAQSASSDYKEPSPPSPEECKEFVKLLINSASDTTRATKLALSHDQISQSIMNYFFRQLFANQSASNIMFDPQGLEHEAKDFPIWYFEGADGKLYADILIIDPTFICTGTHDNSYPRVTFKGIVRKRFVFDGEKLVDYSTDFSNKTIFELATRTLEVHPTPENDIFAELKRLAEVVEKEASGESRSSINSENPQINLVSFLEYRFATTLPKLTVSDFLRFFDQFADSTILDERQKSEVLLFLQKKYPSLFAQSLAELRTSVFCQENEVVSLQYSLDTLNIEYANLVSTSKTIQLKPDFSIHLEESHRGRISELSQEDVDKKISKIKARLQAKLKLLSSLQSLTNPKLAIYKNITKRLFSSSLFPKLSSEFLSSLGTLLADNIELVVKQLVHTENSIELLSIFDKLKTNSNLMEALFSYPLDNAGNESQRQMVLARLLSNENIAKNLEPKYLINLASNDLSEGLLFYFNGFLQKNFISLTKYIANNYKSDDELCLQVLQKLFKYSGFRTEFIKSINDVSCHRLAKLIFKNQYSLINLQLELRSAFTQTELIELIENNRSLELAEVFYNIYSDNVFLSCLIAFSTASENYKSRHQIVNGKSLSSVRAALILQDSKDNSEISKLLDKVSNDLQKEKLLEDLMNLSNQHLLFKQLMVFQLLNNPEFKSYLVNKQFPSENHQKVLYFIFKNSFLYEKLSGNELAKIYKNNEGNLSIHKIMSKENVDDRISDINIRASLVKLRASDADIFIWSEYFVHERFSGSSPNSENNKYYRRIAAKNVIHKIGGLAKPNFHALPFHLASDSQKFQIYTTIAESPSLAQAYNRTFESDNVKRAPSKTGFVQRIYDNVTKSTGWLFKAVGKVLNLFGYQSSYNYEETNNAVKKHIASLYAESTLLFDMSGNSKGIVNSAVFKLAGLENTDKYLIESDAVCKFDARLLKILLRFPEQFNFILDIASGMYSKEQLLMELNALSNLDSEDDRDSRNNFERSLADFCAKFFNIDIDSTFYVSIKKSLIQQIKALKVANASSDLGMRNTLLERIIDALSNVKNYNSIVTDKAQQRYSNIIFTGLAGNLPNKYLEKFENNEDTAKTSFAETVSKDQKSFEYWLSKLDDGHLVYLAYSQSNKLTDASKKMIKGIISSRINNNSVDRDVFVRVLSTQLNNLGLNASNFNELMLQQIYTQLKLTSFFNTIKSDKLTDAQKVEKFVGEGALIKKYLESILNNYELHGTQAFVSELFMSAIGKQQADNNVHIRNFLLNSQNGAIYDVNILQKLLNMAHLKQGPMLSLTILTNDAISTAIEYFVCKQPDESKKIQIATALLNLDFQVKGGRLALAIPTRTDDAQSSQIINRAMHDVLMKAKSLCPGKNHVVEQYFSKEMTKTAFLNQDAVKLSNSAPDLSKFSRLGSKSPLQGANRELAALIASPGKKLGQ